MPEQATAPTFEFNLGDYGGKISITSPDELNQWNQDEWNAWQWLRTNQQGCMQAIIAQHDGFRNNVEQYVYEWRTGRAAEQAIANLKDLFSDYYCERKIFHTS